MSRSEPIELGLTIPLQRHLHTKALPYGQEPDRRFCWDLHVISLRGRSSLLAVHCHSRYTFVLYDLSRWDWEHLPDAFRGGLERSLSTAGQVQTAAALGQNTAQQRSKVPLEHSDISLGAGGRMSKSCRPDHKFGWNRMIPTEFISFWGSRPAAFPLIDLE